MSENGSRWYVDTMPRSCAGTAFDMTMLLLTDSKPGYLKFDPCDREDLRDFIIELVREIERLQTENIDQKTAIDLAIKGNKIITQRLDEIIAMVER